MKVMEGTKPTKPTKPINNMEGTPPLRGEPYPTFKCGQNVKINLFISALAKTAFVLTLTLTF
jgi:hypothetical protein